MSMKKLESSAKIVNLIGERSFPWPMRMSIVLLMLGCLAVFARLTSLSLSCINSVFEKTDLLEGRTSCHPRRARDMGKCLFYSSIGVRKYLKVGIRDKNSTRTKVKLAQSDGARLRQTRETLWSHSCSPNHAATATLRSKYSLE